MHTHPTLSEALQECFHGLAGHMINFEKRNRVAGIAGLVVGHILWLAAITLATEGPTVNIWVLLVAALSLIGGAAGGYFGRRKYLAEIPARWAAFLWALPVSPVLFSLRVARSYVPVGFVSIAHRQGARFERFFLCRPAHRTNVDVNRSGRGPSTSAKHREPNGISAVD